MYFLISLVIGASVMALLHFTVESLTAAEVGIIFLLAVVLAFLGGMADRLSKIGSQVEYIGIQVIKIKKIKMQVNRVEI